MTTPAAKPGRVIALFLHPAHGALPLQVPRLNALADAGIEHDVHSHPGSSRQVLLVESTDLKALGLRAGDLREQITVDFPGLMELPAGASLLVGRVRLTVTKPCEPCTRIGELLFEDNPEVFRRRLVGRRGILARVASGGPISTGDPVRLEPPS